jgi:iron(III) transport system permease protein
VSDGVPINSRISAVGKDAPESRHPLIRLVLPALILLVLGFLVIYPTAVLVAASFLDKPPRPGEPFGQLTAANYLSLFSAEKLEATWNSLIFSSAGSLIALAAGSALAWLVTRTDVPAKTLGWLAGVMPLFISSLVGAVAYSLIASPRSGYVNLLLRDLGVDFRFNVYSGGGIVFVLAVFYAPYAFLLVASALRLMNPELEEAAEAHGASRLTILRTVTFPMVAPAILGAGILILVLTIENFPVPQILGTPSGIDTVPGLIFRMIMFSPPRPTQAAAIGILLVVIMVGLVWLQSRLLSRRAYHTVSGKGFRPKIMRLGRWRWPAFCFCLVYLLLGVVFPLFALMESALRAHSYIPDFLSLFDTSKFSLDNFAHILEYQPFLKALKNSILLGIGTAIFGTLLHFVLSYYVNRTTLPLRRTIEQIAMMPVAIPSLIIGVGFLWAWIALPLPIYGTLTILVLAYTARFMPQGYRSISATILQVHRDLEDSAVVSGASSAKAVTTILVPLIRPGIVSAMLLLFVLALRELSTSIFLFTSETQVLAIVLYEQWEAGSWSRVATISILYSALLLAVTFLSRRWLGIGEVNRESNL